MAKNDGVASLFLHHYQSSCTHAVTVMYAFETSLPGCCLFTDLEFQTLSDKSFIMNRTTAASLQDPKFRSLFQALCMSATTTTFLLSSQPAPCFIPLKRKPTPWRDWPCSATGSACTIASNRRLQPKDGEVLECSRGNMGSRNPEPVLPQHD